MATSTNAFTPIHPATSRRRLLTVGGAIILAAAMIGGVAVAATLTDTPAEPFARDLTLLAQGHLAEHVLRENGALVALPAAPADAGGMLRHHVLRENGEVSVDGSASQHEHVLRENASTPAS